MQQLTIEHEDKTTGKVVEKAKKDRRPGKGRVLALSRRIYRLQNTDTFYVESETSKDLYYFVRFNPSVLEWCSCPDNSTRHLKCKHLFAIEFAIKWGTLKDTDKLPPASSAEEAKRYNGITTQTKKSLSYEEDEYSF